MNKWQNYFSKMRGQSILQLLMLAMTGAAAVLLRDDVYKSCQCYLVLQ